MNNEYQLLELQSIWEQGDKALTWYEFKSKYAICDDCEVLIDVRNDSGCFLTNPWAEPLDCCYCENCREKRWDHQQERLMEEM